MTAPRFTAACVQMRSTRDPLRNPAADVVPSQHRPLQPQLFNQPQDAPPLPSNPVLRTRVDHMLVRLPKPPQVRYYDLMPLLHQQWPQPPVVGPVPRPAMQQHNRRPLPRPVVSQREPVYRGAVRHASITAG